jgi:hypothetical protein
MSNEKKPTGEDLIVQVLVAHETTFDSFGVLKNAVSAEHYTDVAKTILSILDQINKS